MAANVAFERDESVLVHSENLIYLGHVLKVFNTEADGNRYYVRYGANLRGEWLSASRLLKRTDENLELQRKTLLDHKKEAESMKRKEREKGLPEKSGAGKGESSSPAPAKVSNDVADNKVADSNAGSSTNSNPEEENPSQVEGASEKVAKEDAGPSSDILAPLKDQEVFIRMKTLIPLLTCKICNGYLRDAHTITECLHTFCKSCLFKRFANDETRCPTCNVSLGHNPMAVTRPDHTVQTLLDKLVPSYKEEEKSREAEFYAKRNIQLKRQFRGKKSNDQGNEPKRRRAALDISFQLVPDEGNGSFGALKKPFLRTSKKLRIGQIKKYLANKLKLDNASEVIQVSCRGEALGDEHELEFIFKTRWRDAEGDLVLNYRKQNRKHH